MLSDVPDEQSTEQKQFAWVSDWLSKKNLLKTLDTLLEEYNDVLDAGLNKAPSKTVPKEAICGLKQTFSGVHKCSVLSVHCHPSRPWIISTDTSKNLVISSRIDGSVLTNERSNNPFLGAIISLDINPVHHHLLVIGTMDDNHALLEIKEGDKVSIETLRMWKVHKKYVVRTKWMPDGAMFATASHDGSIVFYKLSDSLKEAEQVKQVFFNNCIEAIEFTKDGKQLIASVRDDPCLQYINTSTWEVYLANSNALGDGHVSFVILDLKCSPDGKYLLASTDHSRAILFKLGTSLQIHNFYGLDNDGFSQPRIAFDNNGLGYLTSQDNCIHVFDSATGQLVEKFNAHSSMVRDITYLASEDMIVTCSYDKSIKIWGRKEINNVKL